MEEFNKIDTRIRNIALLTIVIAAIMLIIWIVNFLISPENASPLLITIGLAMLLAGILLFTRIQYVIWAKKTYDKPNFEFLDLL